MEKIKRIRKSILHEHLAIKGENFFFLLISLLVLLITEPFLINIQHGKLIFLLLFLLVFSSSIYAIGKKNKQVFFIILFLIVVTAIFRIFQNFYPSKLIIIVGILSSILTLLFITILILAHVLRDKKISLNEIYGAICAYLLIGIIWGLIYFLITYLNPTAISSFAAVAASENGLHISQSMYFSLITLTSTGYGDIFPVTNIARVVAYLEAVAGQLYLVVLVGWMVGTFANKNSKS